MRNKLGTRLLIGLLLLLLVAATKGDCAGKAGGEKGVLTGKVVSIADGDTLTILQNNTRIKIRLYGINCPELGRPYSTRAKEFTSELALGKVVTVQPMYLDPYQRTVGVVLLPDGKNLNHELVRAGLAWWFRRYAPDDKDLERLEAAARRARRGLWANPNPAGRGSE